jgi:hypothetical protein
MKLQQSVRLTALSGVLAALSACGGGGGSNGAGAPPPSDQVPEVSQALSAGLAPVTRDFPNDDYYDKAKLAVQTLNGFLAQAHRGIVMQRLAALVSASSNGINLCPEGGSYSRQLSSGVGGAFYRFDACGIVGYTVTTTSPGKDSVQEPPISSAFSYQVRVEDLAITPTGQAVLNLALGYAQCDSTPRCISTLSDLTQDNQVVDWWGNNFQLVSGSMSGWLQDSSAALGNISFNAQGYGPSGGTAFAFFSDAYLVIKRQSENAYQVWVQDVPSDKGFWIEFSL